MFFEKEYRNRFFVLFSTTTFGKDCSILNSFYYFCFWSWGIQFQNTKLSEVETWDTLRLKTTLLDWYYLACIVHTFWYGNLHGVSGFHFCWFRWHDVHEPRDLNQRKNVTKVSTILFSTSQDPQVEINFFAKKQKENKNSFPINFFFESTVKLLIGFLLYSNFYSSKLLLFVNFWSNDK